MKIIKIKEDHYIGVDDSEIKEGDWLLDTTDNTIWGCYKDMSINLFHECKKITHSTQPLEYTNEDHLHWNKIKQIYLSEVKELIGEVDVEKRIYDTDFRGDVNSYKNGYNQSLEDNKEKKYTEEDMRMAYFEGKSYVADTSPYFDNFEQFIQSIQPKIEWEVEIVDGKLKLK